MLPDGSSSREVDDPRVRHVRVNPRAARLGLFNLISIDIANSIRGVGDVRTASRDADYAYAILCAEHLTVRRMDPEAFVGIALRQRLHLTLAGSFLYIDADPDSTIGSVRQFQPARARAVVRGTQNGRARPKVSLDRNKDFVMLLLADVVEFDGNGPCTAIESEEAQRENQASAVRFLCSIVLLFHRLWSSRPGL